MKEFKKKLVTLKFLKKKFLKFPRKKKIALCHGVFDIVHPGHLRHLIYTKKKAEFLIVSIICLLTFTRLTSSLVFAKKMHGATPPTLVTRDKVVSECSYYRGLMH